MTTQLTGTKPFVPASDTRALALGSKGASGVGMGQTELLGIIHKTVIPFKDTTVALVDNAGVVAYGSRKIYTFPTGVVLILGAVSNVALTKSSAGVNADWDGDFALGTAAASNNATLTGTENDILPSTATPQAVSGATTATGTNTATSIASLTDNSAGSADDTIEAMANPTDSPATADALRDDIVATLLPAIRNNIADLTAKVNAILTVLSGGKLLLGDGHATAKDVYFNLLVDDADHDVTTTPCNLILNGSVTLLWVMIEDF